MLRLGHLHQLLLLQRVHHIRQAAFTPLRRPEGEARPLAAAAALPDLVVFGGRGSVIPIVDGAASAAVVLK